MSAVETRLRDALFAGVSAADESPDLFAAIDKLHVARQHRSAAHGGHHRPLVLEGNPA